MEEEWFAAVFDYPDILSWVVIRDVELDKGCIMLVGYGSEPISDGLGVLPLVEFNYCSTSGRTQRIGASPSISGRTQRIRASPSTNNYEQNK